MLRMLETLEMKNIFCFGNKYKKPATLGSEDGLCCDSNFEVFAKIYPLPYSHPI